MGIRMQIRTITPEWATKALARNIHNRPKSHDRIELYARDMKRGQWVINHQGIAFDENGDLLDGQTRLEAVVLAGVAVDMMVTTGLPILAANSKSLHTMDTVDNCRIRSNGQNLGLRHGYKNGNRVAASARTVADICCGRHVSRVTTPQTLAILEIYGGQIGEVIAEATNVGDKRATIIGTLAFARAAYAETGASFAAAFFSMEELKKNHPALALRRWISNHPHCCNGSDNRYALMKVIASAIYHLHHNTTLTKIYQNDDAVAWLTSAQKKEVKQIKEIIGCCGEEK